MEEAKLWKPAVRGKAGEKGLQETSEMGILRGEKGLSLQSCKKLRIRP